MGGTVVGLTGLIVDGDEGEIEPVVVSPEHRDTGVGKTLVEYAVQKAKERKVRFLSVKPVARNIEAVSFFVNAGFDIVGHVDLFQDLHVESGREWKAGISIHGNRLKY